MSFSTIPEALEAFARGEFLVVLDRETRENEGDLIISGSTITQAQMAFFVKHTSGYICAPCHPTVLDALQIPPMVTNNTDRNKTAYAVTVDYAKGTTTGISAHDRALTARMLAAAAAHVQPNTPQGFAQGVKANLPQTHEQPTPESFTRPGHLVPLRYRPGGTRVRQGHTEASIGTSGSPLIVSLAFWNERTTDTISGLVQTCAWLPDNHLLHCFVSWSTRPTNKVALRLGRNALPSPSNMGCMPSRLKRCASGVHNKKATGSLRWTHNFAGLHSRYVPHYILRTPA